MRPPVPCGQALVRALEAHGVDTVYGIPGVHTLALYRGLESSAIRHVQPRHEQGAGFMADGHARLTGRPGVCFLISGPGVTNALTPMAQAHADSLPMLVISSDTHSSGQGLGRGELHEVTDLVAMTRPVTAFSARVNDPDELPALLARAFAVFRGPRPRPVHLAIPIDVLERPLATPWSTAADTPLPSPRSIDIERAAALLDGAEHPLVIAGGGALQATGLAALGERLCAPVITTTRAKGVIPDSHPLALGGLWSRPVVHELAAAADLTLVLGSELAETEHWQARPPLGGRLLRVDTDPAQLGNPPADLVIQADAAATVDALLAAGLRSRPRPAATADTVARVRARVLAGLDARERRHRVFLHALRNALDAGAAVVGDMCQVVYSGAFLFQVEQPLRWHSAGSYCTLGGALPGAIGMKLAEPSRPVLALCGDGGFQFTATELLTASECALGLPVIVWNNRGYQQIRDDMLARGQRTLGVHGRPPDFNAFAAACGADCFAIDGPETLSAALDATFAGQRPALLVVDEEHAWLDTAPAAR